MNPTVVPATASTADSAPVVEEVCSAVEPSLVTSPATRMAVDARGLELGILAALASVFALSVAQSFLVPLLLGIIISYTLYPLVGWLEAMRAAKIGGSICQDRASNC